MPKAISRPRGVQEVQPARADVKLVCCCRVLVSKIKPVVRHRVRHSIELEYAWGGSHLVFSNESIATFRFQKQVRYDQRAVVLVAEGFTLRKRQLIANHHRRARTHDETLPVHDLAHVKGSRPYRDKRGRGRDCDCGGSERVADRQRRSRCAENLCIACSARRDFAVKPVSCRTQIAVRSDVNRLCRVHALYVADLLLVRRQDKPLRLFRKHVVRKLRIAGDGDDRIDAVGNFAGDGERQIVARNRRRNDECGADLYRRDARVCRLDVERHLSATLIGHAASAGNRLGYCYGMPVRVDRAARSRDDG